jgi:hypothetical protein
VTRYSGLTVTFRPGGIGPVEASTLAEMLMGWSSVEAVAPVEVEVEGTAKASSWPPGDCPAVNTCRLKHRCTAPVERICRHVGTREPGY